MWYDTKRTNVVKGHFRTGTNSDWAVLCSANHLSTILVYWGGQVDSVAELAANPEERYVATEDGKLAFIRSIGAVDTEFVRSHFGRYGGPEPPPLDHDGINDAFEDKASVVWYWYQGQWLQLTGAD